MNEQPRSKLRGIEHPSLNSFRGKPRGIEPGGINGVGLQNLDAAVKWAENKFYCQLQTVKLTHVLLLLLCAWMSPLHAANPQTINIT